MDIRLIETSDREWVRDVLQKEWGSVRSVSRGRLYQPDQLPGLIAMAGGNRAGLLTYRIEGGEMEVVTLNALEPGKGAGAALLAEAREIARQAGCRRLWLITTNDNEPAIRFYERRGMRLAAVHKDALLESRKLKPEIPLTGVDGKPILDEIEFEYCLEEGKPR
jgi:ribosomal protein S18 acetylase RimI-like enzyme